MPSDLSQNRVKTDFGGEYLFTANITDINTNKSWVITKSLVQEK